MGQRKTCFTSSVEKPNNKNFSVNYVKETPLLPLFVIDIGYVRQVEQRSVLSDNDRAVDRNLTTVHVLLDFNSAQRKEFWSVRRLVCYNLEVTSKEPLMLNIHCSNTIMNYLLSVLASLSCIDQGAGLKKHLFKPEPQET